MRPFLKIPQLKIATLTIIVAVFVITWLASDFLSRRHAVEGEALRAEQAVALLASGFQRELEKFRLASVVLAQDPDVTIVTSKHGTTAIEKLNRKLESLALEMKASAIYVMDETGTTLSASNWNTEDSFVGENYNFRAYFKKSISEGSFEQFALGTRSGYPGLYIARRIDSVHDSGGVVIIKVIFDDLETEWAKTDYLTFATNQTGIILVTSKPEWRFQTTTQLTEEEQAKIRERLEYGDRTLQMNSYFADNKVALAGSQEAISRPYIEAVETLAYDWVVHALTPTGEAVRAAVNRSRSILVISLIGLTGLYAIYLQFRRNAKLRADAELEMQMKEMNDRLAQANKLATLGQVAAGVGHEINQPLAAIGSFSANAAKFIEKNDMASAQGNLVQISSLVDRIGNITKELRGFAQKATGVLEPIPTLQAIDGAVLLLRDRISSMHAKILIQNHDQAYLVMAERNRLEQVFVNLFQNALDAGGEETHITISFNLDGESLNVYVSDSGPGLTEFAKDGLFQPFTSSKRNGLGLGLVISRDIMSDFGGELRYIDSASGATFLLRLELAK